jgi:hypothetical protein
MQRAGGRVAAVREICRGLLLMGASLGAAPGGSMSRKMKITNSRFGSSRMSLVKRKLGELGRNQLY